MVLSHPLLAAIDHVGLTTLARELGVTHQAVRKWEAAGRMPRTEWTGETHYSETIERLTRDRTGGIVTKAQLLAPWPAPGASTVAERSDQPETPENREANEPALWPVPVERRLQSAGANSEPSLVPEGD